MASLAFPSISTTTTLPNGTTYNYVHIAPSGKTKPYVLFLHGFPSSSYDWRHQIHHFAQLGYGILAPDLLGYGGTDKPKELEAYKLKKMSEEVMGLLDAQGVGKVIGVGHDWGSGLLSRVFNYFPARFWACAFLSVGYIAPAAKGNTRTVEDINQATKAALGYETHGYWLLFREDDAASLMDRNSASTDSLLYGSEANHWRNNLCAIGGARTWLEAGNTTALPSWLPAADMAMHNQIFAPEAGGYGPALNWYKAAMAQVNTEDEAELVGERTLLQLPTLFVACQRDEICVPVMMEMAMRPSVSDLTVKSLDSGHWVTVEKAAEVNALLEEFFKGLKTG